MSHFLCIVITPKKPTEDEITAILLPYREGEWFDGGKWDWLAIGGRWSGFFAPRYDPNADPANQEVCNMCGGTGIRRDAVGMSMGQPTKLIETPGHPRQGKRGWCNGCDGRGTRSKWPTHWRDVGNQVCRADLELEELRNDAAKGAGKRHDRFHAALAGRKLPDFDALRDQLGVEKARAAYGSDPAVQAIRDAGFFLLDAEQEAALSGPRDAFVATQRDRALTPFAFVRDGKWHERGEMGWFGITTKAKEPEIWEGEFSKLLDQLAPSDWLTAVDCHI